MPFDGLFTIIYNQNRKRVYYNAQVYAEVLSTPNRSLSFFRKFKATCFNKYYISYLYKIRYGN